LIKIRKNSTTIVIFIEIKNNNEQNDNIHTKPAEIKSLSPESRSLTKDIPTLSTIQPIPSSEINKTWNYSGIDIMSSGAFWQNYQGTYIY
jgi:hypothetical protein